ncbi:LysE family translocator [Desulfobacula sp.]|uniref:LysE family translocator n=1 Tax=Desulfobacula sp. TaxID=2593537 RepID=UPI0026266C68|nr:LysE family translocator [Desulfobacula sp.]
MMNIELWIPFILASTLILIIPGPTIILVISQAVSHGRWSVLPLVTGVVMGDFTAMTLSFLGLGAVLSTSAVIFGIFKWFGALYLMYLGIKLWTSSPETNAIQNTVKEASAKSLLKNSFVVTALNPKSIAFFVAFLPQFLDPTQAVASQFALLGGTFLFLGGINAALYAIFAGQLNEHMKKRKIRVWFNRCGGSALVGAGIVTAGIKQTL